MNIPGIEEKYMRRCLQLARCGAEGAPPNPMVGAVIVAQGRIIGEGYHAHCGEAHAEVNAVASVKPADSALLAESTLYVSLEPCAHYGRTPPCAELIIRSGIPQVVIGCIDPFSKVKGRGVRMLRDAGVSVLVGLLEDECRELNRRFFIFHTRQRPYITLKWARSADGYIDRERQADEPTSKISTAHSLMQVHRLRAMHQAILVGHHTLLMDHPSLSLRHWSGPEPRKIVLGHIEAHDVPPSFEAYDDPIAMLSALHSQGVQSLLVEGGRETLQWFIDHNLWDEACEEVGTISLHGGTPCPTMPSEPQTVEKHFGATVNHWLKPL